MAKKNNDDLLLWGGAALLIGLLIFKKKTTQTIVAEEDGRQTDITSPLPAVLIPEGYAEGVILPDTPHVKGEVPIIPIAVDVVKPIPPLASDTGISEYPQKPILQPKSVVDQYGNEYNSSTQYY